MSTKEKLIKRFSKLPNDFTFNELVKLFDYYGFLLDTKGKTSGSRVRFKCGDMFFDCHKPHPQKVIRKATMRDIYDFLTSKGLL